MEVVPKGSNFIEKKKKKIAPLNACETPLLYSPLASLLQQTNERQRSYLSEGDPMGEIV